MQDLIDRLREYASIRKGELAELITEAVDALERQTCDDAVSRQQAIDAVSRGCQEFRGIFAECEKNLNTLPAVQTCDDAVSRQVAIDALAKFVPYVIDDVSTESYTNGLTDAYNLICQLPSAQPKRKWIPCSNPPKHHKDVIVRGIEAIGNVTVHKVMQWDVDTWRPTDYAPSVTWKEWSEI